MERMSEGVSTSGFINENKREGKQANQQATKEYLQNYGIKHISCQRLQVFSNSESF